MTRIIVHNHLPKRHRTRDAHVLYSARQLNQWKADAAREGDKVIELYGKSPNEPAGSGPWWSYPRSGRGETGYFEKGRGGWLSTTTDKARDAKPSFDDWMKQVDRACLGKCGMSIHDLEDCPFRDWYDAGVKPESAAARCIKRSGG